jgi:hypothetical protein
MFLYQPAIAGVLKKKLKKSANTHMIYFLKLEFLWNLDVEVIPMRL